MIDFSCWVPYSCAPSLSTRGVSRRVGWLYPRAVWSLILGETVKNLSVLSSDGGVLVITRAGKLQMRLMPVTWQTSFQSIPGFFLIACCCVLVQRAGQPATFMELFGVASAIFFSFCTRRVVGIPESFLWLWVNYWRLLEMALVVKHIY